MLCLHGDAHDRTHSWTAEQNFIPTVLTRSARPRAGASGGIDDQHWTGFLGLETVESALCTLPASMVTSPLLFFELSPCVGEVVRRAVKRHTGDTVYLDPVKGDIYIYFRTTHTAPRSLSIHICNRLHLHLRRPRRLTRRRAPGVRATFARPISRALARMSTGRALRMASTTSCMSIRRAGHSTALRSSCWRERSAWGMRS